MTRARWLLGVGGLALGYYLVARSPLPLVASGWHAGESDWSDGWHRRHRMADWMVLSGNLRGLTREQVVVRLGEPPPATDFEDWELVYSLGAERGLFPIDTEWLVLHLDHTGRVSAARIERD